MLEIKNDDKNAIPEKYPTCSRVTDLAIITSIETKDIKIYPVSKAVNNGRTDHEGLIDEMKTLL